jgi:AraC-like DNA-binding protein
MRDTFPRLPPLADQMDAFEGALRTGYYGPRVVRPTCDGHGFAVTVARDACHSDGECVRLGDGAWLIAGTARLDRPLAVWSRNRGIGIDVAVRGGWQAVYTHAPGNSVTVSSGYGSVSLLGQDTVGAWLPFVGIPNEYVSLLFRDEPAMRAFGLKSSDLAVVLGELAVRQVTRGRTYVIEPNSDMLGAARAIRQAQFSGASRLLYMRAKAYELLANLGASRHVANPGPEGHARPAADDASVAALAVSAMGDCTMTLDLRALARQLDVTENRLVRAFKTTYGTTPFGYANRARIERGRAMLLEGCKSLIDIALACGYEHHSSFTTAYRRTYGETPRETRLLARRSSDQASTARSARPALSMNPPIGQFA